MELILDIILEKRRLNIQWRQIVCAVLLAFLAAGLYNYTSAQPEDGGKFMKAQSAAAMSLTAAEAAENLSVLPQKSTKADLKKDAVSSAAGKKDKDAGKALAAAENESNYAVSYGGTETEVKKRTRSAAASEGRNRAKAIRSAKSRTDGNIKNVTETVPAVPAAGVLTESKDILTDTKPITVRERFPGFLVNEKGHITGYTDASKFMKDHLVVFPVHAGCTGIEKDALKGLETEIFEIYIPANISYIADGAFDDLENLYYIEVSPENGRFYSENGVLYHRNGKVAACPRMIMGE